jgi:hypothetical protein
MHNLIHHYQREKVFGTKTPESPVSSLNEKAPLQLIIDNLPEKAKMIDIEALMDHKNLKYSKIEILSLEESV